METLKEKFEAIAKKVQGDKPDLQDLTAADIFSLMEQAYELGKAEDKEKIQALAATLESMGETNKQMGKRLLAANDAFVWLLGYTDFPKWQEGERAYYWRSTLRKRLEKSGFILSLPNSLQQ